MSEANIIASTVGTWIAGIVQSVISLCLAYIFAHYYSKQASTGDQTNTSLQKLTTEVVRLRQEVVAMRNLLKKINPADATETGDVSLDITSSSSHR